MDAYLDSLGKEWTNFEEKLKTLPLTNKNARDFVRFFLSGATECDIDKQGRFLIVSNLREYAGMEKKKSLLKLQRSYYHKISILKLLLNVQD